MKRYLVLCYTKAHYSEWDRTPGFCNNVEEINTFAIKEFNNYMEYRNYPACENFEEYCEKFEKDHGPNPIYFECYDMKNEKLVNFDCFKDCFKDCLNTEIMFQKYLEL